MQPNLGSAVVLYGRQDVLARLDEYFMQLDAPDAPPGSRCGYVFLLGSAGTGTSVIARKWAQRAAQLAATHVLLIPLARKTPPEKLRNCLRQQLLSLFERTPTPDLFTDSLDELLSQVSARLSETGQRLFLVLNSLDEVEDPQLSMPLPQLSPHIFALCAAEPTPPVTLLQSLCNGEQLVRTLDLDTAEFRPSALHACSERIEAWLKSQIPQIRAADAALLRSQMLARADGNMLYLECVRTFLEARPRKDWIELLASLPQQLAAFLDIRWLDIFGGAPLTAHEKLKDLLLLLAVAYEPVHHDVVRELLDYPEVDHLMQLARWWVRTDGEKLQLFHSCAHDFLDKKLGEDALKHWHLRLAEYASSRWTERGPWLRGYALLYAPRHFIEAGRPTEGLALALRGDFFTEQVRAAGPAGAWVLLDVLTALAQKDERYLPLLAACRVEAGHIGEDPEILGPQLFQRLCNDGITPGTARDLLNLPATQPVLRLARALPATERPHQVLQGPHLQISALLVRASGKLVSLDNGGDIKEWDTERARVCRSRDRADVLYDALALFEEGGDLLLADIKGGVLSVVLSEPGGKEAGGQTEVERPLVGPQVREDDDELLHCAIFGSRFAGVTRKGHILSAPLASGPSNTPHSRFLAYRSDAQELTILGVTAEGLPGEWRFPLPDALEPAGEVGLQPCITSRDGALAVLGLGASSGLLYVVRPHSSDSPDLRCICRVHARRQVTECVLSTDGELAFSSDRDGHLALWETRSGGLIWRVSLPLGRRPRSLGLAAGPDEVTLFAGLDDGGIWSWVQSLRGDDASEPVDEVRPRVPRVDKLLGLTSAGELLALCDTKLLVWGWEDDTPTVIPLPGVREPPLARLLTRAGSQSVLIYSGKSTEHAIFDLSQQQLLLNPIPEALFRQLLAISPSGQLLLVGDGRSGIRIVRLASPDQQVPLCDAGPRIYKSVISADESTLVMADGTHLRIWDLGSGQIVATLCPCEPGEFYELVLSPDGRELLAITEKGWRRWDLTSRKELDPVRYPAALTRTPVIKASALLSQRSRVNDKPGPDLPCVALINLSPPWLMVCRRDTGECLARTHGILAKAGLVSDGNRLAAVDSSGALCRMELRPQHDKARVHILFSNDVADQASRKANDELTKHLHLRKNIDLVNLAFGQEGNKLPGDLDLVVALLSAEALGDRKKFWPRWEEALSRYWAGDMALLAVQVSGLDLEFLENEVMKEDPSRTPQILMADTPLAELEADGSQKSAAWRQILSTIEQKLGLPNAQPARSTGRQRGASVPRGAGPLHAERFDPA